MASEGQAVSRILAAVPPASGAVVMGTGVVSIDLSLAGHETASEVLLGIGAATWVMLAFLLPARALADRGRFRSDLRSPAAFTAVAGTAVLAARLTTLGAGYVGIASLVLALAIWLAVIGPVLRHWSVPTMGASFLLTVGTESLAVLAAALAAEQHARWLLVAALAPFGLGLAFYLFTVVRFDRSQLAVGRGDHWVTGGALAISTVAAGRLTLVAEHLHLLPSGSGWPQTFSLVLWVLTMLWLPALVVVEVLRPRPGYDVGRWATVFPVGMYAACSFVVGSVCGIRPIADFAEAWGWVTLVVWCAVASAMLRRSVEVVRPGPHRVAQRISS